MPLFSLTKMREKAAKLHGKAAVRKPPASQSNVKSEALVAPVAAAFKEDTTLTFHPGRLGWKIDGNRIAEVAEGSQAASLGVQAGWTVCSVDGQPFAPGVEDAIDVKRQGHADFAVTFCCKDGPAPVCPGCRNAMVWDSYSGGAYANGWTCCNVKSCGSRNVNAVHSRWFCNCCQNDFCSECHAAPVAEDAPANAIIGVVLARIITTVLSLWAHGRRCKRRCVIQRSASARSTASNRQPAVANALAEAEVTQVPVSAAKACEVAADASSSPSLLTWPRLLFIGLFSRSVVVVLLLWAYSRRLGRRLKAC